MDDLLIRGGHVIDGTGAPGLDADVSVAAGRIVAVELRSSRPNSLATAGATSHGKPHPRPCGTHARRLGTIVRVLGLLTLPAAAHKSTGAAAAAAGRDPTCTTSS